jgi:hypothetical protein
MTLPAATVPLAWEVTAPTVNPAPVMAVLAAAWVSPTTFGTLTAAIPLETTSATADPSATLVAAAGFSLMTLPAATVLLAWEVTVPTVNPAPVMAELAAAWVSPTTFGTLTAAGPLETTSVTADPWATLVAAAGLSLITFPEATVLLDWVVTVPTVNPAPVMAELAAAWVSPTTFGTLTVVELPEPPESPPPPHAVRISAPMNAIEPIVIHLTAFVVMCAFHPVVGILKRCLFQSCANAFRTKIKIVVRAHEGDYVTRRSRDISAGKTHRSDLVAKVPLLIHRAKKREVS